MELHAVKLKQTCCPDNAYIRAKTVCRRRFRSGFGVTVRSARPCGERLDADFGWMEADSVRLI
jgi:hypothetical protein